ncbi:unnamed protein product [Phyllotreta striolata]|uniref:Methyltransferase type 12 domain-containing protein n=1 Tax=Phyllotreta striolata TaxID=444603 RepID=A0A9N9XT52_PHYSR|nr:unnamed protein product [Phyllotreta striolata]
MASFALPQLYKDSSEKIFIATKILLEKYKHLIKIEENASIFEFGVGDGSHSAKLLYPLYPGDYKEIVATDLSQAMLNYAKNNENIPRCAFSLFDVACETVPEDYLARFDNVFSLFTLMLVRNTERAFKNIYAMLKPNGRIFSVFHSVLPTNQVYEKLSRHPIWGKYDHNINISSYYNESQPEKGYERALKQAGFDDYTVQVETFKYTFKNEKEWKDFFYSVNVVAPKIPQEEIEDYKKEFFKLIENEVLIEDESVTDENGLNSRHVTLSLCVLSATK